VAPERVILELTEREAIRDLERLRAAMALLRAAGVRIAADDVGAGNAGLRLLSQFRFDVVKIDLSLVQGSANEDQTLSVLTSLVELARQWGALTIAEGVETAAQLQMIRQLGIEAGQGYLLGRPGSVIDAEGVDLDALAAGPPSSSGPRGPILGATGLPAVAAPSRAQEPAPVEAPRIRGATAPGAGWHRAMSPPSGASAAIPTAASVIAGGAPNPFEQG
jgi:hypothetical protein